MSNLNLKKTPREVLKEVFGYDDFREGQEEIINEVLKGNDVLAIMSTGSGKSLLFQVPALILDGLTIVVSPLLSLMKDQNDTLIKKGVASAILNSTLSEKEYDDVMSRLAKDEIKILFVAPERFNSESFTALMRRKKVSLMATDESHAASCYGHDFRPEYSRLGQYRKAIGNPPCIAVTATATQDVKNDIVRILELKNHKEFCFGFARPNLIMNISGINKKGGDITEQKLKRIEGIVGKYKTGIIYCSTRKAVDSVSTLLQQDGYNCIGYHAGLTDTQRKEIQDKYMSKEVDIIVASTAFGMGLDRADVRFVISYTVASSIEDVYQNWGRAGRDGQEAYCEMFFADPDIWVQNFFASGANPDKSLVSKVYDFIYSETDGKKEIKKPQEEFITSCKDEFGSNTNSIGIGTAIGILCKSDVIEKFELDKRAKGIRFLHNSKTPFDKLNIDWKYLSEKARRDFKRLDEMISFSKSSGCVQRKILDYFEPMKKHNSCGKCSHCTGKKIESFYDYETPRVKIELPAPEKKEKPAKKAKKKTK